ncbi:LacI family DNA-binding transcriptional regulator [Stakelama saccharophila]|uniref:LacI family DNA-binding transcriptional regulator n=1 Tax=Stakelama saccharophila TaxID=3075605 RepID=A0ABZ0B595_9SPHN|nr:LacI family DNA-binding transcriptional regulator [Stakelama sp. W311]WNO52362.1 LacI family DNA-binding transcriptional regulator [Stakelama sp. W311]
MATSPRKRRNVAGRQGTAPTISDVAKLAGVSPMTVSRVINADSNVRETTREAVNEAIARLNYSPNPAARSLAGAGQRRVALLYSNPSAAYLSEFLVGSLDQASRSDVQLIVEKCDIGDHEIEVAEHLIKTGIDGMILPSPLCDSPDLLQILIDEKVPAVSVGAGRPVAELHAVSIDEQAAARAMTRHLINLGHQRIGFIIGSPKQTASGQRLDGYLSALEEAGIARDDKLIAQGFFSYRSGLDAAETLLDQEVPPTAIFASNDDMAAASVAVAHRKGIDVPGDLTVCGFDDTALATAIWPELTTIHQPIADMSRAAVELIVSTLRAKPKAPKQAIRHLQVDYTLVRRQSDAAPRRRPGGRLLSA